MLTAVAALLLVVASLKTGAAGLVIFGVVVIVQWQQKDSSLALRDRSKITSHNLFAKVLKALDILQTECVSNVFPFP